MYRPTRTLWCARARARVNKETSCVCLWCRAIIILSISLEVAADCYWEKTRRMSDCLPYPPLGGAAFSPLFCWVVLLGFLRLGVVLLFSFLLLVVLLGLLLLWAVLVFQFPFRWCCLPSPVFCWVALLGLSFFGWCCFFPLLLAWCFVLCPPWSGAVFPPLFCFDLLVGCRTREGD